MAGFLGQFAAPCIGRMERSSLSGLAVWLELIPFKLDYFALDLLRFTQLGAGSSLSAEATAVDAPLG